MDVSGADIRRMKAERNTAGLLKALEHRSPKVKKRALVALHELVRVGGSGVVLKSWSLPIFTTLFQEGDPEIRQGARLLLEDMAKQGSEEAVVHFLLEALWKGQGELRREATIALGRLVESQEEPGQLSRKGMVPALARLLREEESRELKYIAAHVLSALAQRGAVRAVVRQGVVPEMVTVLTYGKWELEPSATEELEEMSDEEAAAFLKDILSKRTKRLGRDAYRDVFEMLKEPGTITFPQYEHEEKEELETEEERSGKDLQPEERGTWPLLDDRKRSPLQKLFLRFLLLYVRFCLWLIPGATKKPGRSNSEKESSQEEKTEPEAPKP